VADDKLAAERRHDAQILVTIIQDIGEQLRIIVFNRRELFRGEYRQYFPGPWQDVEGRLNRASHELEAMQPDDLHRQYIEGAGLVRDSLQFKRNMLTESIKQGVITRLLKIINSILGSLTAVFGFLEAVKEYKEARGRRR
jgi:hypothetical protein